MGRGPTNRAWPPPRQLADTGDIIDAGSREHYADAALYDHHYKRRDDDVAFYRDLARQLAGDAAGIRVLDVACGSGRVGVPLAEDGHTVVGLDLSPAMLAAADARAAAMASEARRRLVLLPGDMRDFDLGAARFDLVIAVFNAVEHLYTRVELEAFLTAVKRHLAPGGRLAFDVQMPDMAWLLLDPYKRWSRSRVTHPTTRQKLIYSTNHDYDPISQIAVIRLYYEPADGTGRTRTVKLTQRKFFPAELEALLAASGFVTEARFGDFRGAALMGDAEVQVMVARPVGKRRVPDGEKGKKPRISDGVRPAKRTLPDGKSRPKNHPSDGGKSPRRKRSDGVKRPPRRS